MAHILHSSGQSRSSIATSLCSMTYTTDREEEVAVTMACPTKRRALGPKEELTSCFPCKPVGADWQGFFSTSSSRSSPSNWKITAGLLPNASHHEREEQTEGGEKAVLKLWADLRSESDLLCNVGLQFLELSSFSVSSQFTQAQVLWARWWAEDTDRESQAFFAFRGTDIYHDN